LAYLRGGPEGLLPKCRVVAAATMRLGLGGGCNLSLSFRQ